MNLKALVSVAEDGPWCGTKPPWHRPVPQPHPTTFASLKVFEKRPHPEPVSPELVASMWQSIQLFQAGQRLESLDGNIMELGSTVARAASVFFDDQCGSVPWSVILYWLLHNPPPPPPPWLQLVTDAVSMASIATRIGGDIGGQMLDGAQTIIKENLPGASAAEG
ncbi:hypothetical protein GCT13_35345 [Paraburkholderia sp. CNPSo 3157]|uniref:Uncharacterized protein n=1 Tax=Paraburkholderia franconis TaxID=2654983 RepID=A0A7X1NHH1_9BURK|nr:hypothetical protein [Paraburkholderia franconis]MPW21984.1 hypothetical protein [Paraburkholderia franconis]